jgi:hypothetical protein
VKLQNEFAAEYFRAPTARLAKKTNYSSSFFFVSTRTTLCLFFRALTWVVSAASL